MSTDKRNRSANLDDTSIEEIIRILDGWSGKITWNLLIDAIESRMKQRYTRQALSKHARIQKTYNLTRERIAEEADEPLKPTVYDMAVLIQQNKRLEAEVARLHQENNDLLAQFAIWAYNAYNKGLTLDILNKHLPKPPRHKDAD